MSKVVRFTIKDFLARYPDDDACLEDLWQRRFGNLEGCPSCGVAEARFHRVKKRKCYECAECAHQIYPMAGTIMQGSTTPLRLWYYAIYLFASSKNGVSAKELERQLGVTYKCAHRMGHKIRELMTEQQEAPLSGVVELDEMLFGGAAPGKRGWGAANKVCLFGMVERGGRIRVIPVPDRKRETLLPIIEQNVEKGSTINTDEFRVYQVLREQGYDHRKVVHSKYQWAQGENYTNSIEGYWSNLKKSIFGTHTYVSPQHLPKYLAEFGFRHGHRRGQVMFDRMMEKITDYKTPVVTNN